MPGTSATLAIAGEFKPLVETPDSKRLFEHYAGCANDVGLKVEGEFTGGCADSGFTAAVGTPTICAVGPVGGKAHTPDEYLVVDSLVPRAQTLALAVARLDVSGLRHSELPTMIRAPSAAPFPTEHPT